MGTMARRTQIRDGKVRERTEAIISELKKKQYALGKYIAGDGKKNSQIKDVVKFAKEEKTRIL